MEGMVLIKRALISVSDKSGVSCMAEKLVKEFGVEIISTGGTADVLRKDGVPVIDVSEVTGFPEIMDGRLKTLHPKIEGGILGRRGVDEEMMAEHDIVPIDLVVTNLYPFEKTVARPGCTFQDAIENIDIGGPTMIRAAAKNHKFVTVVTDPGDYQELLREMERNNGCTSGRFRFIMARRVFRTTGAYDIAIADYLEIHCD